MADEGNSFSIKGFRKSKALFGVKGLPMFIAIIKRGRQKNVRVILDMRQ